MKPSLFALIITTMLVWSCNKDNSVRIAENKGCIEWKKVRVTDHSGYTINNSNIQIINGLFANNNIDNSKYRYYYYSDDSVQTFFPPYVKFDDKIIRVKEFTNGLEIFTGGLVFGFKNNIFDHLNGIPSAGTTLGTNPKLTIGQIRTLFLRDIEEYSHSGNQYKDSCFSAEFGYYNLNSGSSNMPENLVKCWKVTLKNRIYPQEIPIAYYKDNDGKLIYYDDGIVFATFP
ncbi:MAG TPA: hypothetical protein VFI06_09725 [Chitinophagaceae bacterium]|nr:hypothetical protein [Chitinophagaceae bacterium]